MSSTDNRRHARDPAAGVRALAVVDWSLRPDDVVVALHRHAGAEPFRFGLLVPARLPGLQWIGDPTASRPCAEIQLREVARRLRERGLDVGAERIGDPERVPAITEALSDWAADEIVLVDRRSRRRGLRPLGLDRRLARVSGLPVRSIAVPAAAKDGGGVPWVGRTPRCTRAALRAV